LLGVFVFELYATQKALLYQAITKTRRHFAKLKLHQKNSPLKLYTKKLAEFVTQTNFNSLPVNALKEAKKVLLDTLGAMLKASSPKYSASKILKNYCEKHGGKPEATVIGMKFKTDLLNASLVNGTLAYYCDIESIHPSTITHTAAVVVPTSLSVCEHMELDGKELLTSIIVGYEVETRVSAAFDPNALYKRGFHPSAVAGVFGAAASAGKLFKLDIEGEQRALGLAGLQAAGLLAWVSDETENSRPFQMGFASRNGILSCVLASQRFGAPKQIFEGKSNVLEAFSDNPKREKLVEELGERFLITETAYKRYSCCAFLQPAADALSSLIAEHALKSEQIEQITLRFPAQGAPVIDNNELKSHNAQYILPVLAVKGDVQIDDILFERRENEEIKRLYYNTKVIHDEELSPLFPRSYASIVELKLKDGRTLSKRVDYARGTPQNPMSFDEVVQKFRKLASEVLTEIQVDQIVRFVDQIEKRSVKELVELL